MCGKGDTSTTLIRSAKNPPKKAGAMPSNGDKSLDKRQFYPQDPLGGTDTQTRKRKGKQGPRNGSPLV